MEISSLVGVHASEGIPCFNAIRAVRQDTTTNWWHPTWVQPRYVVLARDKATGDHECDRRAEIANHRRMTLRKTLQAPEIEVVPGVAGRWFLQVDEDLPKPRVYLIH